MGEHFSWVSWGVWRYILGEWEWVDIFYGCWGGWRYILSMWKWADIFYGCVGVSRGIFWVGRGGWTFFMGGSR